MRRVESYLNDQIKKTGCIHLTLIDPDKCTPLQARSLAIEGEKLGTSAFMIGGSTCTGGELLDELIKGLKSGSSLPVILFPGSLFGISKYADAVWFMSVLNSSNVYYITGAQAIGARMVREYNLEAIPLGYIIVSPGGTAGFISQAMAIPHDKPEVAAIYSLAAQYMGMRFVYLERGSGVEAPVPSNMVQIVRKVASEVKLVVGGGIKTREQAKQLAKAGAEIIVTGNVVEEKGVVGLKEIIGGIEEGVNERGT
ncbi:MAG: geranylgeranylglyceryl/heptaprenylglyceryl phosphate synthase [Candidatus Methanosuratincola sp.]|jgi:phosphoglycerol geranylgeranyltransferase|nr:geranylgeranylglyceryl/heptaprenylglyceryl phosphate synthase [Candidatus Methanosuratincola sp.]